MIYLELFWSFFQIGLFSIGGGYAAMPLIEQQTVVLHGWLTSEGFGDIVTIAEMTPGPIALNAATFVGTRVAGLPGALIATIGCVFPSTIIMLLLSYLYYKYRSLKVMEGILYGVRPAVIALIASAGIILFNMSLFGSRSFPKEWQGFDKIALIIIAVALIIIRKWKVKPIYVMVGTGLIYGVAQLVIH